MSDTPVIELSNDVHRGRAPVQLAGARRAVGASSLEFRRPGGAIVRAALIAGACVLVSARSAEADRDEASVHVQPWNRLSWPRSAQPRGYGYAVLEQSLLGRADPGRSAQRADHGAVWCELDPRAIEVAWLNGRHNLVDARHLQGYALGLPPDSPQLEHATQTDAEEGARSLAAAIMEHDAKEVFA